MLCILCGINEEYEKGICKSCIAERVTISTMGSLDLTECPKCGSLKIGKKWYPDNQENVLARKVRQMVSVSDPAFSARLDKDNVLVSHDGTHTTARVEVVREGFPEQMHEVSIPTTRLRNSCLTCNKVTGSYYEAVLQLRTLESRYEPIIDDLTNESVSIMQSLNRKDPESFISTTRKLPEGVDIYLGKRSDGIRLSKHILDNNLGTMTISKSLAGIRDGARFYRFTYSVRLAALERGAVISLDGRRYIVLNTGSAGLDLVDTETDRKVKVSKNSFFYSDVRIIERNPQKKHFIVVSNDGGEMQLMDKDTYNMITMKGESDREEIELFSFDGKFYLPGSQ